MILCFLALHAPGKPCALFFRANQPSQTMFCLLFNAYAAKGKTKHILKNIQQGPLSHQKKQSGAIPPLLFSRFVPWQISRRFAASLNFAAPGAVHECLPALLSFGF